jgi:nicotinate phosphoribosyltransferase
VTLFDGQRLTQGLMQLPVEDARRGAFSDKYFENVVRVLADLGQRGLTFGDVLPPFGLTASAAAQTVGNLEVEAQIFNRRAPYALIGGIDAALAILRHATGSAWQSLRVEAVMDGVLTQYDGHPENVQPVIRIRGPYQAFALHETAMLGYLTRISRIATNVLEVLRVSNGKPVLFFPARFDLPEVQAADGYAYWLAVQRYNYEADMPTPARVSTDAQGRWWSSSGGGTVPHALIACFLGHTAAAMVAVAEALPIETPRIVLADFKNDAVVATTQTLDAYWAHYREAFRARDDLAMRRWTLNGVRLDTAGNLLDASLTDPDDKGVSPALIRVVRAAIDAAWQRWGETGTLASEAQAYCQRVQIVVTGGFNRERIERYEAEDVPVDVYGVGSSLLINDRTTSTDFTMDIVNVKVGGGWVDAAKVGRRAGDNAELRPVDLAAL